MDDSRTVEFAGEEHDVLLSKAQYGLYFVRSSTSPVNYYPVVQVNGGQWSCTCEDYEYRQRECKHVQQGKIWARQLRLAASMKFEREGRHAQYVRQMEREYPRMDSLPELLPEEEEYA